ncbi:uncharacterized protein LOC125649430 isoform X2 [Ostrea edulis]|uniref:uncharacterized protein LOC125649430 isoform X2 n=1 Tax=Ostrea edulis TaxID=37623 RepID=UPI0024AF1F01|nr:uncharacterized protein LOC125649430 isoform X2 [Ostrea edulis]
MLWRRAILAFFGLLIVRTFACPEKCSCNGTLVMCDGRELFSVPPDIPNNTTVLFLGRNNLSEIAEGKLQNVTSLEKLYLYDNEINDMHQDALCSLRVLTVLSMSYNELKTIKRQYFQMTTRLISIDLSKNDIEVIEDSAFKELKNLQKLRLNSNKIKAISNTTFQMLTELEKLELQDNDIETIGNLALRDLRKLRSFSRNRLKTLPARLFDGLDSLEELYLSSNEITEIRSRTFNDLPKVKFIVLNRNLVTRVEVQAFQSLPLLDRVYLDGNQIGELQKNCFLNGTRPTKLYLGSNPLRCDCGMKWLMEFVKTHQITLGLENKEGDSVATLCNEPETLRGRSVHSLPLTSYHCDCRIPGQMYEGTENKTSKGVVCQSWSKQIPHRHDYDVLGHNQSNYCRNYDREIPWCLTNDVDVLWDYCQVPICDNVCYDLKYSRSFDICPVKKSNCSEVKDFVRCHLSSVEKTNNVSCFESFMMERAVVSSLVEQNIIRKELSLKCFPSPCADQRFLEAAKVRTYSGLMPYNQHIFCWSVMRLINTEIANITVTNKSTCYERDKMKILKAIQNNFKRGMFDEKKFLLSECPLSVTYDEVTEEDDDIIKNLEEFILTNLHFVIGGMAGFLLIIAGVVLLFRLRFKRKKKENTQKVCYNNRQSHIYHDIGDIDDTKPYEMERCQGEESHSYISLQPTVEPPDRRPSRQDIGDTSSSSSVCQTGITASAKRDTSADVLDDHIEGVSMESDHANIRLELNKSLLRIFQSQRQRFTS